MKLFLATATCVAILTQVVPTQAGPDSPAGCPSAILQFKTGMKLADPSELPETSKPGQKFKVLCPNAQKTIHLLCRPNGRWALVGRCIKRPPKPTTPPQIITTTATTTTPEPVKLEVTCDASKLPKISNSKRMKVDRGKQFAVGTRLKLECIKGFVRVGRGGVICEKNGTWNQIGTCLVRPKQSCDLSSLPLNGNGHLTGASVKRLLIELHKALKKGKGPIKPGFTLQIECVQGNTSAECRETGEWQIKGGGCTPAMAPPIPENTCRMDNIPVVPNGRLVGVVRISTVKPGYEVSVACRRGLKSYEVQTHGVFCQPDGTWKSTANCGSSGPENPPRNPPANNYPPNSNSPVNNPPNNYWPNDTPPSNYPPNNNAPNKPPSNKAPPNRYPPQKNPPSNYPPNHNPPSNYPPNNNVPNKPPSNKAPPNRYPPQKNPPSNYPPNNNVPNKPPSNNAPPNRYPPNSNRPSKYPPNSYRPNQYRPNNYRPNNYPTQNYAANSNPSNGYGYNKYANRYNPSYMRRPISYGG